MAVEKPRPEDRTIIGYDKQGNAKTFELDKLPGGRLPAGFSDEPPPGKHPNTRHLANEEHSGQTPQPPQSSEQHDRANRGEKLSGEEQKKSR